jgi:ribonucleoside-diphosphate reductase alpha chain
MSDLFYLNDELDITVDRILTDNDLADCGLSKKEVIRTLKSFGGDEIACSVFLKKYALRNEDNKIIEFTLNEAKDRWATCIVNSEIKFENRQSVSYFRELYEYFLPAGRQMFALGNSFISKASYANCYVTKIEEDSLEGIFDAAKKLARTYSYGGGIGLCIGELRPINSKVSNSSRFSTGSVSFMELYSLTTGLVGQHGRRGALMITIPVEHPDILNFISIKHGNINKVKYANISVKLTDEFMNAVIENKNFTLSFKTHHEEIRSTIKAKDLWNKIVKSARDSAEPGLLFWDRMIEMSPSDTYERLKVHSTNPCVSGDTWVFTKSGPRQVKELIGKRFVARVDGQFFPSTEKGFFQTGTKKLLRIKTKHGFDLKVTEDHKVLVRSGSKKVWKLAKNLSTGDCIVLHNHRIDSSECWTWGNSMDVYEPGYILGLLVGDGQNNTSVESIKKEVLWSIKTLRHRSDFAGWHKVSGRDEERIALKSIHRLAAKYGITNGNKIITDQVERSDSEFYIGFLKGLFDANGSVQGNLEKGASVRLSQSNLQNLKRVQRMLARLGIISKIYKNRREEQCRLLPNGRGGESFYNMKAQHELVISKENLIEFHRLISFCDNNKRNKLWKISNAYRRTPNRELFGAEVCCVEEVGVEKVYDASIPGINAFDANGLYVHNCGEQILEPGGTCVLSSLLIHKFVKNPYTNEAYFDFELFREMVKRGVRHLDNVIELNVGRHALEEQEVASCEGRRIGLGITGLADMYTALSIKYDSKEALELIDKIMHEKKVAEYNASIDLAIERGSFPLYNPDLHFNRSFASTLPDEIKERAKKYGLRNVALSTIAPSGSLSVIAQCSSGIEPIFALSYTRFVEMGSKKKKFKVFHQGLSRFYNVVGKDTELPDYWVVAHDIDYKYRVKLQGILQKHTDASISSTINLPKEVDVDTVSNIYIEAWKEGLKGITVYREGSREGVLITDEYAKLAGVPNMDTVIYCIRAEGGDKFYTMISYRDGDIRRPYQVFVMNYKQAEKDAFVKIGNALVKMVRTEGVSEERVEKYLNRSNNSLAKLTRFLSLSMKTGNLVKAAQILDEHAFAGTLAAKLYDILNKSIEAKNSICQNPNCNGSNVKMEEGCIVCLDCGWSGCA